MLRQFPVFILLVAQLGREARLADSVLYALGGKAEASAGGGDDVLFDHDGAEVVGAGVQAELGHRFAYRQPGSLYVGDVG